MQKISRTKTGVSARTSPAHCGKCTYQPTVTTGAGVRAERSALFYLYIIPHNRPFVKRFSKKNSDFSFSALFPVLSTILIFPFLVFPGIPVGYDTDVYREKQQKSRSKRSENSPMYAFTQKFVLKFVRIPNLQNGRFAV
jgi:hypothetical protein